MSDDLSWQNKYFGRVVHTPTQPQSEAMGSWRLEQEAIERGKAERLAEEWRALAAKRADEKAAPRPWSVEELRDLVAQIGAEGVEHLIRRGDPTFKLSDHLAGPRSKRNQRKGKTA